MKKDRVYPLYHNTEKYEEPDIYGIAKYNLHYHSMASTSNSMYYSFRIGEVIQIKGLCGDDLQSHTGKIVGINPAAIYVDSYQTENTEQTRVQSKGTILTNYSRFSVFKNQHYIKAPQNNGFVSYTTIKEMLYKQSHIVLDLKEVSPVRAVFIKNSIFYLSNIQVSSNDFTNSVKISRVKGNTPESPTQQQIIMDDIIGVGLSYNPDVLEELVDEYLLIEGSGTDLITVEIFYYAS